jgi:hypothetical protein
MSTSKLLPLMLSAMFLVPVLRAQVSGTVSGTIVDASGATVPDANVTGKSVEFGTQRSTTTDSLGHYQLSFLPVGNYEVRVTKPGFSTESRSGIKLAVGENAVVDLRLRVGEAREQVSVTEDAPIVSTTNADISGLVAAEQVKSLPLNGRSYDLLLTLNPGVVNYTSAKTGGVGVSNSTVGNNFAISGNRPQQNLFLLNGVEFTGAAENNMQPGGTSQQLLGVDAVREFNVLRTSYDPQYGKRPGAQVLIVTQSGSNQIHGSAYEFLRNNAFDARNFFDGDSVPGFTRNQFGGSIGAPIVKDKTFAFANFEVLTQHLHQTGVNLVPDNEARAGYLPCKLVTPPPKSCPSSGLVFVGVSSLINAWPVPTPGAPDFGGISEAYNNPLQTIRDDFGTARIDHTFSSRDTLNTVYTIDDSEDFTPTSTNLYSTDEETLREQVASLSETHVFSPSLINQATFGYSRASYFFTGEPTPGTPAADLTGFLLGKPVGAIVVGGSAASNPTAQLGLAGSNNGSNLTVARNLFTYEDRVSWTKGRHQVTVGGWLQRLQSNETLALSQYGQATFTSLQTLLQNVAGTLLYDPSPTRMYWRSWFGAWYVQDTIRVRDNLNVSLGFRGESSSGWNENRGHASTYTFTNGVINSQPQIGDATFTVNNATFLPQPRLGLAWSPAPGAAKKTVINAGFGMYNELQDALGYRTDQNAPFNPVYSLPNAKIAALPIIPSAPVPATAKLVPGGVQPDLQTPTLISWSLRLQQELSNNTSLSVGYVGSHGYHEILGIDANEPFPVVCPASPCPANYPKTFPAPYAHSPVPAGTYHVPTAVRANPTIANTWTYFSQADASYNALQVDLNRRFNSGLGLRGAYTWSKVIDNGDSVNATTNGGEPALASNPFYLPADRGLANFDVRHVGSISAVYALPFGRGMRFGQNTSAFANALISGWNANSIVTLQGGFPFTPQLSYNPSNNGDTRNPVRPFVNPNFTGSVIIGSPNQWFNPAAFLQPPPNSGFYGNLGRDTLIGPGLATWDLSFLKDNLIGERTNLQFRAEFFNVLNHANFGIPNAIVFTPTGVSPSAGVITSTSTTSRQIQFALKLLW